MANRRIATYEVKQRGCGVSLSFNPHDQTVHINSYHDGNYQSTDSRLALSDLFAFLGLTLEDCYAALGKTQPVIETGRVQGRDEAFLTIGEPMNLRIVLRDGYLSVEGPRDPHGFIWLFQPLIDCHAEARAKELLYRHVDKPRMWDVT